MDDLQRDDNESTNAEVLVPPPQPFMRTTRSFAPSPEEIAAMQRYFIDRKDELLREVAEIEAMLGFVVQATELAVRVAKIENFLGIKA